MNEPTPISLLTIKPPKDNTVYFYRSLVKAIEILATSSADMKQRLVWAGDEFLTITPEGIHEDLREDVYWIQHQLTRYGPILHERSVKSTVWRIKNSTREKIAARMFDLFLKYQYYIPT